MAEYIFTPTDTVHPTEAESQLLGRLIKHEYALPSKGLSFSFTESVRTQEMQTRSELRDAAEYMIMHLGHLVHAPIELMDPRSFEEISPVVPDCSKLLEVIKTEITRTHPRRAVYLKATQEMPMHNLYHAIYLQLFVLAENALDISRKSDCPILMGCEQVRLDDLTVLGKNNQTRYDRESPFVRAYVSNPRVEMAQDSLRDMFSPRKNGFKVMGLSLTDWVCDAIHGFVKVESEVGKGSTFSLYFPQERKK